MYPLTLHKFDANFNCIMTKFFDMKLLEGADASTASSLFDSVNSLFEQYDIFLSHCMGAGLDNKNANIGEESSIKYLVFQKNNINAGCPCYILHNCFKASQQYI